MIHAYLYRAAGAAWCVVLALNVHKHGWHPMTVVIGAPLAVLLLSLGVAPERRTAAWDVRYVLTAVSLIGLVALRLLRV
jgi:hypothetical protein